MSKVRKKTKQAKSSLISPFKDYWKKENIVFLTIGMILLVIGYILMATDPWDNPIGLTLSPLVLLAAYLIFFPLSIFYKKKSQDK